MLVWEAGVRHAVVSIRWNVERGFTYQTKVDDGDGGEDDEGEHQSRKSETWAKCRGDDR